MLEDGSANLHAVNEMIGRARIGKDRVAKALKFGNEGFCELDSCGERSLFGIDRTVEALFNWVAKTTDNGDNDGNHQRMTETLLNVRPPLRFAVFLCVWHRSVPPEKQAR